jgi:hypothetical protein
MKDTIHNPCGKIFTENVFGERKVKIIVEVETS